jgi:hypothetical protein
MMVRIEGDSLSGVFMATTSGVLLSACSTLLGADFDRPAVVAGGAADGGTAGDASIVNNVPAPVPAGPGGTCAEGRKLCDASCVSVFDPKYGCGSASCAACAHSSAACTTDAVCTDSACQGSACNTPVTSTSCDAGGKTTLKGVVYDPAGVNPLFNVAVYIPGGNTPEQLPPLADSTQTGITCGACAGTAPNPYRVAITDETGTFVLDDVPVQNALPIVIQVGKWRRLIHVDVKNGCAENVVADGTLRLPKNGLEGDMPQIAVTTGAADSIECLLRGVGIDDAEFVSGTASSGHVHLYAGGGGGIGPPAQDFWNDASQLKKYDMVFLSCEGDTVEANKGGTVDAGARGSMHDYLNAGGKVFASHYQTVWFEESPSSDFQNIATWADDGLGSDGAFAINESFPKGQKFSAWLENLGAASNGVIALSNTRNVADSIGTSAVAWISPSAALPTNKPMYFAFNTPLDATGEAQCGRAMAAGLHVLGVGGESSIQGCSIESGNLSAQQKALEFLFFDLAGCNR